MYCGRSSVYRMVLRNMIMSYKIRAGMDFRNLITPPKGGNTPLDFWSTFAIYIRFSLQLLWCRLWKNCWTEYNDHVFGQLLLSILFFFATSFSSIILKMDTYLLLVISGVAIFITLRTNLSFALIPPCTRNKSLHCNNNFRIQLCQMSGDTSYSSRS